MKTLSNIFKQHTDAVLKVSLTRRLITSVLLIAIYIIMLNLHDDALTVGTTMAILAIANQLDIGAWEIEDIAWGLIVFTWYTVLYSTIAALFI